MKKEGRGTMRYVKWWAKRIVFLSNLVCIGLFLGAGCSPNPPLRVTEERLAELEENIGVQLLKYNLGLDDRDFEILAPYLRTDVASVENENIRFKVECIYSDAHFNMVVTHEELLEDVCDEPWKINQDWSVVFTTESPYFSMRRYGVIGYTFQWPEELGEKPDNIYYDFTTVKAVRDISSINVELFPALRKNNAPIGSDKLFLSIEKEKGPDLVCLENRDGFENVSVSPFYIWADCRPVTTQYPIYDVFIQYKDGTEVGYTKEEFEKDTQLSTSELPWDYFGYYGSEIIIKINPPFLELDKISSITINGTKFPLTFRS